MDKTYFLLHEKLNEQCEKLPASTIIEFYKDGGYTPYTYKDILNKVQIFTSLLKHSQICETDHIAIISENMPEWICAYFASLNLGAINVPVDPQLTDLEISTILKDADIKVVFTSKKYFPRIGIFKKNIDSITCIIVIDEQYQTDITSVSPHASINLDQPISILYTSGTTASPKGVVLSHRNISDNLNSIQKTHTLTDTDILLSILPLHHIYPFTATMVFPLLFGTKIIIAQTIKREELLKIMKEKNVTILAGVPQIFQAINNNIMSELEKIPYSARLFGMPLIRQRLRKRVGRNFRFFLSGGAKLDESTAKNLYRLGLPILEGYGLTETSPVVAMTPLKKPKIGSAGIPVPGVDIRIHNPDFAGVGEILIKGQNVMQGYYKKPAETKEVIKDGWFYSGDLGRLDAENYLYITGRVKEVIVLSSGKNIYPEELESFYLQIPFIKELCIIGRPQKHNTKTTESLWAIIVPNFEYFEKTGSMDIHGSVEWALKALLERLPQYRRISGFTIVREDLPRTRLGKIKRYEVENKYREIVISQIEIAVKKPEDLSEEDKKILKFSAWKAVSAAVTQQKKIKREPALTDHIELDLGIDSLGRIELLVSIETLLKVKIPEHIVTESHTLKDLTIRISNHIKNEAQISLEETKDYWETSLKRLPDKNLIKKIDLRFGLKSLAGNFIIIRIINILYRIFWAGRIYGVHNIPETGPYIICSNHQSFLDGPLIVSTIPFRKEKNLYFIGLQYYFDLPILRLLARTLKIIPLDPSINLVEVLKASAFLLHNKKSICIFPEGSRSPDGKLQEFKKGTGILLKHVPVPLVPVYIKGSYQSWPIGQAFPKFCPLTIRYGKPVSTDELSKIGYKEGAKDDYSAITSGLRLTIKNLENT